MGRDTTPPDIKAAAIADLVSGEQPAVVAERYKLRPGTVRQWKARLELPATSHVTPDVTPHGMPSVTPTRYPTMEARQAQIADLVLRMLIAKLTASERLALHVTSTEWLNKQSAADVAELGDWLDRTALAIVDRLAHRRGASGDNSEQPDAFSD